MLRRRARRRERPSRCQDSYLAGPECHGGRKIVPCHIRKYDMDASPGHRAFRRKFKHVRNLFSLRFRTAAIPRKVTHCIFLLNSFIERSFREKKIQRRSRTVEPHRAVAVPHGLNHSHKASGWCQCSWDALHSDHAAVNKAYSSSDMEHAPLWV